ncbi:PA0069 family radical SAM protein [Thioalkalivibrio sp.]|uniref:PA0069 family radical SAM protein n=1 Tax=Thioalkalivibrio sp. TaxID=2093813 RepID=UPI00356340CE
MNPDQSPRRPPPSKGRGALSNRDGRFEPTCREVFDDGWNHDDEELPPPRTTLGADSARSVITRNDSPDVPFEQSINPYRGCEHGCAYCFARPTHAYLGLSPGLDFETRLFAKQDAATLLRTELARRGYRCSPIALGINTDAYQPVERERRVTRELLEVLHEARHPVSIVTKSALVERDLDLLASMARDGLVQVALSITTLDRALARRMEPRAAAPQRRLETVRRLRAAGVPTAVLAAPLIPVLTDPEIEAILEAAAEAGADVADYVLLRLPHELAELFPEWLEAHRPLQARHVLSRMRGMHGGKLYESRFGQRMSGTGPYAEIIRRRFHLACGRLGLNRRLPPLRTDLFRPPAKNGQLSLL